MKAKPKPERGTAKAEKAERREALAQHRKIMSGIAQFRDAAACMICRWRHDRMRRADHVHHVNGRGRTATSPREHWSNLLCVCAECHPPGTGHLWVNEILQKANMEPANPLFVPGDWP